MRQKSSELSSLKIPFDTYRREFFIDFYDKTMDFLGKIYKNIPYKYKI